MYCHISFAFLRLAFSLRSLQTKVSRKEDDKLTDKLRDLMSLPIIPFTSLATTSKSYGGFPAL
ncbi:hypothetical protein E2C01_039487 [Portunus trituberculatus]|uniref:Uncharacterized protein n=1 Tax=Portunus trituberculatus TaxID=210409 RepID=A0A5B7FGY9_PORTR|nr:hypothetical protein [Portunus trituberculatus]